MKIAIPIEDIQAGDRVGGKRVVDVLHRDSAKYVRATLEGGWPIVDGYWGTVVTVDRAREELVV